MNKLMKKLAAAVLVLSLALSLAACGVTPVQQAERAVKGLMEAFKVADIETASKYMDTEEMVSNEELAGLPDGGMELFENIFSKMQYEIISSEQVSDEQVRVTTKITAVDMKPVFGQYVAKALEYVFANAFTQPTPSDEEIAEEMMKIFNELLTAEDLATVTNEVVFNVVEGEENWKVEADEKVTDALLGGLVTALEEMEESFGEE